MYTNLEIIQFWKPNYISAYCEADKNKNKFILTLYN